MQEYLTNSAAVFSSVVSEFEANETPSWYSDIPDDVQSYLDPIAAGDAGAISSATEALVSPTDGGIASASASISQDVLGSASGSDTITSSPSLAEATAIGNATEVSQSQASISSAVSSRNESINSVVSERVASNTGTVSVTSTAADAEETDDSSTGGAAGADSEETSSAAEEGSAAMPTALTGGVLAGAVGLVGLLAL